MIALGVSWNGSQCFGLLSGCHGWEPESDGISEEDVFRKVVGFSNNEFDHFSTASLITRSTNDIQQVQVLAVMVLRMVSVCTDSGVSGGVYQVFQTNVSMSWIIAFAVGLDLHVWYWCCL